MEQPEQRPALILPIAPAPSQVTAPATEAAARPGQSQRWRTSLHAQGALAVEGEAHIWRGGSKDKDKEGGSTGSTAASGSGLPGGEPAAKQQDKSGGNGGGGGEEAGGGEEPRRTKLASALERAKAADEEPALPLPRKQRRGKRGDAAQQPGGEEPAAAGDGEQPAEAALSSEQGAAAVSPAVEAGAAAQAPAAGSDEATQQRVQQPQRQPGAALESFIRPLEQMGERVSEMGERVSDMLHRHTHPQEQAPQPAGGPAAVQADESGYVASGSSDAEEQRPPPPSGASSSSSSGGASSSGGGPHSSSLFGGLSSQAITATIQDSAALLQRVKDSVQQLTGNVQVG